jgi:hypothetical protein
VLHLIGPEKRILGPGRLRCRHNWLRRAIR